MKVSGNIPAWKAHLAEVLTISPTYLINLGYDIGIDNYIHSGKGYPPQINLYIDGLEAQRAEIRERIEAARQILEEKEIKQSAAQLRIWDTESDEERIIPAREYNSAVHRIKEEIRT